MRPFLISFCLMLSACLPESKSGFDIENVEIVEGEIGDETYFVPKPYFKIEGRYFPDGNIYVQTMYPDFLPLREAPNDLWAEGEWWKNISILAHYYPKSEITMDEFVQHQIEFLRAFEHAGEEYGLIHMTQPPTQIQDHEDVWIHKEDGEVRSIIICSENLIETDFPQCNQQYYLRPKFHIQIKYDRRLLKNWKTIDVNVRRMFESFSSRAAAKEFLRQQIEPSQSISQETEP